MKYLALLILLFVLPMLFALELEPYPDRDVVTGVSELYQLRYIERVEKIPFVILNISSDSSVVIEGIIGEYFDSFSVKNNSLKSYKVDITVFEPGDHVVTWAFTNRSGSIIQSSSFIIRATGNSTPIGKNGVRYTVDNMPVLWYEPIIPPVVEVLNESVVEETITETSPVILVDDTPMVIANDENEIIINTTPVEVILPTPVETPPEVFTADGMTSLFIFIGIVIVLVVVGIFVGIRWLKSDDD